MADGFVTPGQRNVCQQHQGARDEQRCVCGWVGAQARARCSVPLSVGQGHGRFPSHRATTGQRGTKALEQLEAAEGR